MTSKEILKEVLKDPIFISKYGIPQQELDRVSFDTTSSYKIIEVIKRMIQQKTQDMTDIAIYRNIKIYFGGE